jgi:hypothetical protein
MKNIETTYLYIWIEYTALSVHWWILGKHGDTE